MEFETRYITADVKLSEYKGKVFTTEVIFEYHMLVWFISGETKIICSEATYVFGPGDIFLIPRNHIATIINISKDEKPHKSAVMHLTAERLKDFYSRNKPAGVSQPFPKITSFKKHPLLESCLASLIPYFDLQGPFPENIASLKLNEAISILRVIDPSVDGILANFEEPGKIDLAPFMEKNFMFNLPLERFGYLTGRSLSTFNRDFSKIFNTTPQKWLTRKRLELAHYHISEKKARPVDIYLEVGFMDLSHFSFAFKKHFGYSPTDLAGKSPNFNTNLPSK